MHVARTSGNDDDYQKAIDYAVSAWYFDLSLVTDNQIWYSPEEIVRSAIEMGVDPDDLLGVTHADGRIYIGPMAFEDYDVKGIGGSPEWLLTVIAEEIIHVDQLHNNQWCLGLIIPCELLSEVDAQNRVIEMHFPVSVDEALYMDTARLWDYLLLSEISEKWCDLVNPVYYKDNPYYTYTLPWWAWIIKPPKK
jgi:hypothetical protein